MSCLCCLWCRIKLYFSKDSAQDQEETTSPAVAPQAAASLAASEVSDTVVAETVDDHRPSDSTESTPAESEDSSAPIESETDETGPEANASQADESDSSESESSESVNRVYGQVSQSSLLADEEPETVAYVDDDLTKIRGIGAVIEKKLHALGITSFAQIAALDEEGVEQINEQLSFKGRIQREEWIEQARELAKK